MNKYIALLFALAGILIFSCKKPDNKPSTETHPVASFTKTIDRYKVVFTNTSTGNPTSFSWNFGDSSAADTSRNPIHTYSASGTYHVVLTATNKAGSDTFGMFVIVSAPTYLNINCIDNNGHPAPGVAVTVFANHSDWLNDANVAYSGYTDANGNISFSGLSAQTYYFYCTDASNCLTNWDVNQTNGPVTLHTTNSVNVAVSPYGTLKIVNTSPGGNPYKIKVNGQIWISDLEVNNFAKEILPVGNNLVEAIQLNGSTDNSYNVSILQCQTTDLDVP